MIRYRWLRTEVMLGASLLMLASAPSFGAAAGRIETSRRRPAPDSEATLGTGARGESKFVAVPHSNGSGRCQTTSLPEPLTTPSPVVDLAGAQKELSVDFVVGTDGLVHSAFLLKSVGDKEDRMVLRVLGSWRYRPAMCNGVPTEAEATVEFSTRRSAFGLE